MTIRLVNRGLVLDTSTSTAIKDPKKIKDKAPPLFPGLYLNVCEEHLWHQPSEPCRAPVTNDFSLSHVLFGWALQPIIWHNHAFRVYPDISLPATSNDLHYTLSESHYYNQYHSLQQGNRSAACHQLLTRWENRLTPSLALKGKL